MKISCAIFDLDGTLLTSENRISEKDLKTLRDLSREGVKIIIATGRSELQIKQYVNELSIADPIITCNGGAILNPVTREIIHERFLRPEDAKRMITEFEDEGSDYLFYSHDYIYHGPTSRRIDFYKNYNAKTPEKFRVPIRCATEYPEDEEGYRNIRKVLISDDEKRLSELFERFGGNGTVECVISGKNLIDIMPENTSKGRAIKILSEHFSIPLSEIVAFGDSPNDAEMLQTAGFSVAMGNAEESVKKIADFVTKTNDEFGITYALEYIKRL